MKKREQIIEEYMTIRKQMNDVLIHLNDKHLNEYVKKAYIAQMDLIYVHMKKLAELSDLWEWMTNHTYRSLSKMTYMQMIQELLPISCRYIFPDGISHPILCKRPVGERIDISLDLLNGDHIKISIPNYSNLSADSIFTTLTVNNEDPIYMIDIQDVDERIFFIMNGREVEHDDEEYEIQKESNISKFFNKVVAFIAR